MILGRWFGAEDDIEALESLSSARLPGHISYLLRVRNADGEHLVEQQAYYNTDGERIDVDADPLLGLPEAVRLGFWFADQAVASSVQGGQRPVRGARFGIDVLDMMAGCLPRDHQPLSDLPVRQAPGQEPENLDLAVGQAIRPGLFLHRHARRR